MTAEENMKKAIQLAKESEQQGGIPSGAIILNPDGRVVGSGMGLVTPLHDATMHGESMAIRDACKNMNTADLNGCIMFGTIEPCGMCLSAALWANISEIYFGAYADDIKGNNYEYADYSSKKLAKRSRLWNGSHIRITGGILGDECKQLLAEYKDWARKK